MQDLLKNVEKELLTYPRRSMKATVKAGLKALTGRKSAPHDAFSWPNGLLAMGLVEYYKKHKSSEEARDVIATLRTYADRWLLKKCKMYGLQDALSGMTLLDLYEITGEERYKDGADLVAQALFSMETDNGGSIIFNPSSGNKYIFADMIGIVCPFLIRYGIQCDSNAALNLAITQIQNFLDRGMDEKTVLPYHGYDFESGTKYGIIGWGRAVGWLMLGLSGMLKYLPQDRPSYEPLKQAYRRIVDKVEAYQLPSGLYPWQLSCKDGPMDTSATAMILYAIAESLENKVLIGIHKSRMVRGRDALLSMIQEGRVGGASAECLDFNMYPLQFGSYPWSDGPTLALLAISEEEN